MDNASAQDHGTEVFEAFRQRAAEVLDIDVTLVTPDARLGETLHADSVDLIEIAGLLERQFGIELEDRELYDLETVRDFVELIVRKRR
ncbi:MAG: acyl carrier protein [Acidimicrobiales bacterium]|nr:acyl carrier protein [Acidimicrobiales bacterium]